MTPLQLRLLKVKDPETLRRVREEDYGSEGYYEIFPVRGASTWALYERDNSGMLVRDVDRFPTKDIARKAAFAASNKRQPVAQSTQDGVFQLWFHPREPVAG